MIIFDVVLYIWYKFIIVWALQYMWRYEEGGEYPRMILDVLQ